MLLKDVVGVKVKIPVRVNTPHGPFATNLFYTPDQFAALKAADLAAVIAARKDAWVATQTAPPSPPTPVDVPKEELEMKRAQLEEMLASINAEIAKKA